MRVTVYSVEYRGQHYNIPAISWEHARDLARDMWEQGY